MGKDVNEFREECRRELARLTEGEAGWKSEVQTDDDGETWAVFVWAPPSLGQPSTPENLSPPLPPPSKAVRLVAGQITTASAKTAILGLVNDLRGGR